MILLFSHGFLIVQKILHYDVALIHHLKVAIFMTFSRVLTNVSLQYLNYPTQVIFKSMKILFVMVGSFIALKKHYTFMDYLSAVMVAVSAAMFGMGDASVSPQYTQMGLIIVVLSLVADACHSLSQDLLLRKVKISLIVLFFVPSPILNCTVFSLPSSFFLSFFFSCSTMQA